MSDRLVLKPVRLALERFAFEIADGLPDFCDDRAVRSSMKAHRLDVRTDDGPLARPVLAYGLAAMNVATIHTVGPGDIVGERGQHAVYVPRVKAIVDAFKDLTSSSIGSLLACPGVALEANSFTYARMYHGDGRCKG